MRFWIVAGILLCGCSGETSEATDAGTSAAEDAWWNVDAGTTDGGSDDGTTGQSEDPCVTECLASGKAEATPEACESYCDDTGGDDKGGDDKGGDDTGGDDKGGDDKGGDMGAEPGACYYLCVQGGGTPSGCEADCGSGLTECVDSCTAKGEAEEECTKACGGAQ